MAWTIVGTQIETAGTGSIPTGGTTDDLLIVQATNTGSSNTLTVPTGWTEIQTEPAPADYSVRAFYRVIQSGDTTWSWTWSAGTDCLATICIRGADTTTPIDDSSVKSQASVNALTTNSVTAAAAGELFVGLWSCDASSRTWTEDGTLTEQLDGQGGTTLANLIATEELASSGAVTRTGTVSGTAQDVVGYAVVLTPGSGTSPVGNSVGVEYDMTAEVARSLIVKYDMAEEVAASLQVPYDMQAEVAASVEFLYDMAGGVGNSVAFVYDMAAEVGNSVRLFYDMGVITAIYAHVRPYEGPRGPVLDDANVGGIQP